MTRRYFIPDRDQMHGFWNYQVKKPVTPETMETVRLMRTMASAIDNGEGRAARAALDIFINQRTVFQRERK